MPKFTLTWSTRDFDQFAGEAALEDISENKVRELLGLRPTDLLLGEFRLSPAQIKAVAKFVETKIDNKAYDYFITPT